MGIYKKIGLSHETGLIDTTLFHTCTSKQLLGIGATDKLIYSIIFSADFKTSAIVVHLDDILEYILIPDVDPNHTLKIMF